MVPAVLVLLALLVGMLAGLLVAATLACATLDAEELADEFARLVPGWRRG